jgi:acyl carrier protein
MDSLTIIRQYLNHSLRVDPEHVTGGASLKDLGVDSLVLLDMMFDLEQTLGITLDKDLPIVRTVGELVTLLDTLKSSQNP